MHTNIPSILLICTAKQSARLVLSTCDWRLCDLLRFYLPHHHHHRHHHHHHHHRRRRRRRWLRHHWVAVTNFAAAAVAKIRLCTFSLYRRRSKSRWLARAVYSPADAVSSLPLKLGYLDARNWWHFARRGQPLARCPDDVIIAPALSVLFFVTGKRNLAPSAGESDKQIYAGTWRWRGRDAFCLQRRNALTWGCWRDRKMCDVSTASQRTTAMTSRTAKYVADQVKSEIKMKRTSTRYEVSRSRHSLRTRGTDRQTDRQQVPVV